MTKHDDTILEFLEELPASVVLPSTPIHVNLERRGIEVSYRTIRRRLSILSDEGLVLREEINKNPYYSISELGRKYLHAEIDASDLERDEDDENADGD